MKNRALGWVSGLTGVVIFSGSLPATRVAVADFPPLFLTSARAAIAALLGALCLAVLRQARPAGSDLLSLLIVTMGVVIGFPLLTALALQHVTAAHASVFIGILPLSTAVFGVIRSGERPRPAFWLFSALGAATVAGFMLPQSDGGSMKGNLLMLAGIMVCGLGYAEGAIMSRRIGGWQVISWALVLSLPAMVPLALATWPDGVVKVSVPGWVSLGYVSVFSMLVGFVFWYRGLALGGVASVSQLQLLQPFFGLMLAALLLHEAVSWPMIACTLFVVLCVTRARRYA